MKRIFHLLCITVCVSLLTTACAGGNEPMPETEEAAQLVETQTVEDSEGQETKENNPKEKRVVKQGKTHPSLNIKPGDTLRSPVTVRVNSEGLWFAHEGELGWAQLTDNQGNELGKTILFAEGEWMTTEPAFFSGELTFTAEGVEKGILSIHNNPGGGSGNEAGQEASFSIPVSL